jgi:hypothetical protein
MSATLNNKPKPEARQVYSDPVLWVLGTIIVILVFLAGRVS